VFSSCVTESFGIATCRAVSFPKRSPPRSGVTGSGRWQFPNGCGGALQESAEGDCVAAVTVVPHPAALYLQDRFLIAVIWRGSGATFTAQIVLGSQQEYLEGVVPHSNKALNGI